MKAALIACLVVGAGCLSKLDPPETSSPAVTFPKELLCVPTNTTLAEVPGGQVQALFSAGFVMVKIAGQQSLLSGCPDAQAWRSLETACLQSDKCGRRPDPVELGAYRDRAAGSSWQALNLDGDEADVGAGADTYVVVARRGDEQALTVTLADMNILLGAQPGKALDVGPPDVAAVTGGICGDFLAAPCLPGQCEPKGDVPVREIVSRNVPPSGGLPSICSCKEVCDEYKAKTLPQNCDCLSMCLPCL